MYALNIPTEHDGIISKPRGSWAKFCSHFLGSMASCISVLGVKKSESMDCRKTNVIRTFGSLQYTVAVQCTAEQSDLSLYILNRVDRKAEAILAVKDKMLNRFEVFFLWGYFRFPWTSILYVSVSEVNIEKRSKSSQPFEKLGSSLAQFWKPEIDERLSRMIIGMKPNYETKWLTADSSNLCCFLVCFHSRHLPPLCIAEPEKSNGYGISGPGHKRVWRSRNRSWVNIAPHLLCGSPIGGVVPWRISKAELLHKCLKRHVMVQNMQVKQFQSRHDSSSRAAQ